MLLFLAFVSLVFVGNTYSQQITCGQSPKLDVSMKEIKEHGITIQKAFVDDSKRVVVDYNFDSKVEIDSIEWSLNGESIPVEQDENEEVYYTTKSDGPAFHIYLHILPVSARASGNWTMVLKTSKAITLKHSCFVLSQPVIQERLTAVRGHEGYPLDIYCETDGYPLPNEIIWKRYNPSSKTFGPVKDVTYVKVGPTANAILKMPDATNMNGLYMCTAVSDLGVDNQVLEVRVKSKLAPLWPFLGILIELIVLIVIIASYEYIRYRKRTNNTGSMSSKLGQTKSN